MNTFKLLEFFEARMARGEPMVLVTVFDTEGSTYSKAGAQMLVGNDAVFRGMLSGGCLEGDLAVRSQQVLETGQQQIANYDLGADDDELWGMGVGCEGLMRVLLQPLLPERSYAPFAGIAEILRGDERAEVTIDVGMEDLQSVTIAIVPPPRILVLGAGMDAEPVVRFAAELGWRCTVTDHRPATIENGDFTAAVDRHCMPAADLGSTLDLDRYSAAVVMSHHLVSDRSYLEQLAATSVPYIGLLGPAHRRDRLLAELGDVGQQLSTRVHGPAGLDIGGRGPAPIALSIIAEIQQQLERR